MNHLHVPLAATLAPLNDKWSRSTYRLALQQRAIARPELRPESRALHEACARQIAINIIDHATKGQR